MIPSISTGRPPCARSWSRRTSVAAAASNKGAARHSTTAAAVKAWADRHPSGGYPAAVRAVADLALDAIGLDGRGEGHSRKPQLTLCIIDASSRTACSNSSTCSPFALIAAVYPIFGKSGRQTREIRKLDDVVVRC